MKKIGLVGGTGPEYTGRNRRCFFNHNHHAHGLCGIGL